MATFSQVVLDRFWSKVNKDGPIMPHMDTACWQWTAGCNHNGYGTFGLWGSSELAHRISYSIMYNFIKLHVLHTCDNTRCVNPKHLYLGTALDNARDRVVRGREGDRTGINNGRALVTEVQVQEIRRLYAENMSQRRIASKFGLGKTTVAHIVNRRAWAHVP